MWSKRLVKRFASKCTSKPLVTTLAAIVAATATPSLSANELTAAMRDEHFTQVRELIDRELFLVAERAIDEFSRQAYPDPTFYRKGLDFYYAKMATEMAPSYLDINRFRDTAKELEEELQANRSNLPDPVSELFGAGLQRLADALLRKFNPNYPPPAIKMNPNEVTSYQERMRSLIQLTEAALAEHMADIEKFDEDLEILRAGARDDEKKQEQFNAGMQTAIGKREAYFSTFLIAHNPLREVALRGADYGLDQAFIDQEIKPWINNFLAGAQEHSKQWSRTFGRNYPPLQHLCNYVRALNTARVEAEERKINWEYDSFVRQLEANYEHLPKDAQNWINEWRLTVWYHTICWMQEVPSETWRQEKLPEILTKLDEWLDDKGYSLNSRNGLVVDRISQVYFQAAHLADITGDSNRRDTLIVEVQNSKSPHRQNAGKMLGYFASRGEDDTAGGWLDPVSAVPVS